MLPPHAKLTRLVDAVVEPLSLADAKNYLLIDPGVTVDDVLIGDMIAAARLECELINNTSLVTTTWQLTLDYFAGSGPLSWWSTSFLDDFGAIELPMPPLIDLQSISFTDQGGNLEQLSLAPGASVVISPGTPGRIAPAYGQFFPFTRPQIAAVNIVYTAGFGPDASFVPRNVVQAMRLLVSHYYEHRTSNAQVPDAVYNLLSPTRSYGYA